MKFISFIFSTLFFALSAHGAPLLETRGHQPVAPPPPHILRDVAAVTPAGNNYTYPVIPALRTSLDGRIMINLKPLPGGYHLNLLKPESVGNTLVDLPAGAQMLAFDSTPNQFRIRGASLHNSQFDVRVGHITLCEDVVNNPSPAEINGTLIDSYSFKVLAATRESNPNGGSAARFRFWSTPLIVRVAYPKTAEATLHSFELGTPNAGPLLPLTNFFEPMVTEDGKLFFGRVGNAFLQKEGEYSGRYDIAYAVAPRNANRCDLSKWNDIRPLSFMPYDQEMKGRYEIATYPFRDSQGNIIPKGVNIPATYPWIDRQGRNVFFHVDDSMLYFDHQGKTFSRYPARCITGETCEVAPDNALDVERSGTTRGLSVMGLWTHGKAVTLDGVLNHLDYGLEIPSHLQREISLYKKGTHETWIRAAAGRDNTVTLPGGTRNTTFIDSFENVFNMHPHMRPKTLRDVVWIMNRGNISDEVIFDDYMDLDTIIFSEMNASWTDDGTVHNGFDQSSTNPRFTHSPSTSTIRLQNSASSPLHTIPKAGVVIGNGRIEPVALGGIRGKGFFLHRHSKIEYTIPSDLESRSWYFGMFLDRRTFSRTRRNMFTMNDGKSVLYDENTDELIFTDENGVEKNRFIIPAEYQKNGWSHFGFYFFQGGQQLRIYLDGMNLGGAGSMHDNAFQLREGVFSIGKNTESGIEGIRGWIDEIRLQVSNRTTPEEYCNFARGTMIGMNSESPFNRLFWNKAQKTPGWIHSKLSNSITAHNRESFARYSCYVDYESDNSVGLHTLPADTTSVRKSLLFPESPLVYNQSRPDTTTNHFCLSCHTGRNDGVTSGLSRPSSLTIDALTPGTVPLRADARLQPEDPPKRIYGHVPEYWIEGPDNVHRPTGKREFSDVGGNTSFWVHR